MFCPKCGNEVQDGSQFCGQCGNKFENVVTPQPADKPASAAPVLKTTPIGIVAAILALVALIFSFMPWFEITQLMSTVSGATSDLAGLFGGTSGTLAFDDSYTVWGLIGLAGTFSDYVSVYSSFGGSSAAGAAALITIYAWICVILWVVSLVLSVWGAISVFAKGGMGILRAASIFMVATVLFFYFFAGQMGSETGIVTAMPMMCLIVSVIALVCTFFTKRAQG